MHVIGLERDASSLAKKCNPKKLLVIAIQLKIALDFILTVSLSMIFITLLNQSQTPGNLSNKQE